jgi:hypothetical protein
MYDAARSPAIVPMMARLSVPGLRRAETQGKPSDPKNRHGQ